jgi:hypothetical protein
MEDIEAALAAAANEPDPPKIVSVVYRPEPELDLFVINVDDGRRIVVQREKLWALQHATREQAANFVIGELGQDIWWPDVDEGHRLENMLEGRFGNDAWMATLAERLPLAA